MKVKINFFSDFPPNTYFMKHLSSFFFFHCSIVILGVAQAPEIAWEHLYCDASNTSYDDGSFALTPDGGAVMVAVAYNGMECEKNEFGNYNVPHS